MGLFFGGSCLQLVDLALRKVLFHLFPDITLEAADEQLLHILAGVIPTNRQDGRVQHAHQAGKALFLAVVRGGAEQDQRIGTLGQEGSQTVALGTVTLPGHVVGLIQDDQVPPGAFQVAAVLAVALEGIDRDDGSIVVIEGIVV